ncbi:hypothetical protein VTJ04DRAFT_6224 [Mycothermus thermophilus]|uniref:uncharacterized protein n=1 Tax=Humicola insolens TaxID=85995 RepID=UPI003743A8EE
MARKKTVQTDPTSLGARKRDLSPDPYDVPDDAETPRRRIRTGPSNSTAANNTQEADGDASDSPSNHQQTPAKRRGRPPKAASVAETPQTARKRSLLSTPLKPNGLDTPSRRNIADRSARRKSARALIDRVIGGTTSDDELEDEAIAREIYESSEDEDAEGEGEGDEQEDQDKETAEPTTPSKTPGRKRRARRSPTPPRDLPPHEQYFYQNKPGLAKTSSNTLSSLNLLTHDEYFSILRQLDDPHAADVNFLESLHSESFPQWAFELSQGFSACLYGYGSKRRLLHSFATYLSSHPPSPNHKIVIINGYLRTLTARDILATISSALPPLPDHNPTIIPTLPNLLAHLSSLPANSFHLTLLINSIDSPTLRKPGLQSLLATLASTHRQTIRLVCTADTPDFPRLWDAGLRTQFNFVFHDCTTFAPFAACELDVVDEVHELLGRRARRAGGKEGVAFVLKSLPENARSLFRLLVGEVLVAMEEGGGGGEGEEAAVEYRMVYNKAVEEFICSSEMAFRTLLKEFHDHQIITSYKDSIGTELLSLPFRKDELESILEELVS